MTWGMLVIRAVVVDRRTGLRLLLCGAALPLPIVLYVHVLTSGNFAAQPELCKRSGKRVVDVA